MRALPALLLAACTLDARTVPEPEVLPTTVADLRGSPLTGARVTLAEVQVTSPRTADGAAFFVQDPGGGPGSGLKVAIGGAIWEWPPPIGTPVSLTGRVSQTENGPVLTLRDIDDTERLGDPEPVVATPWEEGPLGYDLTTVGPLTVTSAVDPAGRADTSGPVGLGSAFLPAPGWATEGTATGILAGDSLSLRTEADWTGPFVGSPPLEVTLDDLRSGALPEGTPVVVHDLLQISPWSRGNRWAALQDPLGNGLWVDAEAWGVEAEPGRVGSWLGEVRGDGDGLRLRVWTAPEVTGEGTPALSSALRDGDLVVARVTEVQPPDPYGDRPARVGSRAVILDDRFRPLDDLPTEGLVRAVARESPDGLRLAVLEPL